MKDYNKLFIKYGLNRSNASDYIGVTKGYLCDMLKGNRNPTRLIELRTYLRKLSTDILNLLEKKD